MHKTIKKSLYYDFDKKFLFFFVIFLIQVLLLSLIPSVQASSSFIPVPFQSDESVNMEITYNIDYIAQSPYRSTFKIWIPRLKSWETGNENHTYIQSSKLIDFNPPAFYQNYSFDPSDVYNNSFDYYEVNMNPYQDLTEFSFSATYNVTLKSTSYIIPSNLSLSDYNTSDWLYQFYTSQQPYYEINDSQVQSLVYSITHNSTNIKQVVESIYLFIEKSMNYTDSIEVLTLKEIINTFSGDCSEFSTLMVGLLRAAGIPARKVLGIALIDGSLSDPIPKYTLSSGDKWSYSINSDNEIPGHAWVQYYLPTLGWVSADPTWGKPYFHYGNESALQYLYQMDYVHLITTIGGWYEEGIDPPLDLITNDTDGIPEFPFLYPLGNSQKYYFDFQMDFEVKNTTIEPQSVLIFSNWLKIILSLGSFLFISLIFGLYIRKRKQ
ncbi:MAG: transglutaminase-like domain-containing protein [Candidatus Lokiarchaeota archaeon]|nr:transglutaminase-like domain-containing protein [Candidatus Harpocratesius repetitus]